MSNKKIMIKILQEGNPLLSEVSDPVRDYDDIEHLIQDLRLALIENNALGISAVQIGVPKRVFLFRGTDRTIHVCVNPEIISEEKLVNSFDEGCLSVDRGNHRITKKRHKRIKVLYWDENGNAVSRKLRNIEAFCFQHELDHLNGILITDE